MVYTTKEDKRMYRQRKVFTVQNIYNLAIKRKDVDAEALYKICWRLYKESKIVDLSKVRVRYSTNGNEWDYLYFNEMPEEMKQLTALCVCLIGRWFNDLQSGRDTIMERFKLNCKPTDFWHHTEIFKNDDIKCKNMEELIEKIAWNK